MNEERVTSFEDVSTWLAAHERFTALESFKILSRFHTLIDDADVQFWKRVHEERPAFISGFTTAELTAFGREAGGDSPRWWVFAKEPDLQALWNDTKLTFLAAQTLLRASERLGRRGFSDYGKLVDAICACLETHTRELQTLEAYADKLVAKHELAPAILFSYSVWGSTRRADRSLDGNTAITGSARVQLAGELAVGVRRRNWPVLYHAWLEALDDAFSSANAEEYIAISADEIFQRVAYDIKSAFTEYFTQIRDSLRHIDLLCQEARQRDHIYADEAFLLKLLQKVEHKPDLIETDLWELKETLDMWSCPPEKRSVASVTLAEDVAAFANNRGGILIIGVTDRTREVVGITDVENRAKHVESVLRSHIDYAADFFRVRTVPLSGTTCLVIVVGQTPQPVGVRQVNNNYSYPLRVGPGIERVSRSAISARKPYMKGTSFAFAAELASWVGM